jgi:hypothetical protein
MDIVHLFFDRDIEIIKHDIVIIDLMVGII